MDNTNNLRAQLKVTVVGGSGGGNLEYIESCDINDVGELVFITNLGRELNAGKLPVPTFDHMSEEEKKLFLEELIDYITVNGDTINIGGKVYVAELRLENGVYISDKTFEDLKPHIAAGEVVVCDFFGADSRTRCHMTTCTDYSASFVMHSVLGADEYFTFTAEGVTHTVAESGGNSGENVTDYPPYVAVKKTDSTVTVHARRYDEIAEVWAEKVTTITLDEDGYPDTVTQDDGTTTSLTWEGFD